MAVGAAIAGVVISAAGVGVSAKNASDAREAQKKARREAAARQALLDQIPVPDPDAASKATKLSRQRYGTSGRTSTVISENLGG